MAESTAQSTTASLCKNEPFRIVEFARADPPAGQDKTEWYRYVISQGRDPMAGIRQGTRESVTAAVEEIVLRMNERRMGKFGRVHLKMGNGPKSERAK